MRWYITLLPIMMIVLPLSSCSIDTESKTSGSRNRTINKIITVKAGDTIYSLSKRYNVTMRDLIVQNELSAPFKIFPNQTLKFKQPRNHIVTPGETIFSLAQNTVSIYAHWFHSIR